MKATLCPISCYSGEVGPSNPIGNLDLPSYVKETVWNRAKALIDDKSAVVSAPGNGSTMSESQRLGGIYVMTIA